MADPDVQVEDGVLRVILNRPAVLNALTADSAFAEDRRPRFGGS